MVNVILLFLAFITVKTQIPRNFHPASRTNLIQNFHPSGLSQFVNEYKYVFVLYNNPQTKTGKALFKTLKALSKENDDSEVYFIQIHQKQKRKFKKKKRTRPRAVMYVYGLEKKYFGEFDMIHMHNWIQDIITAEPFVIETLSEMESIDSHYFTIIEEKWYKTNTDHFKVLAKLISPLSIFTGLRDDELVKLRQEGHTAMPLFVYREYDKKVSAVNIEGSLIEKAEFILDNEFPTELKPNKESHRLITQLKLPVLIYFTKEKNDANIKMIRRVNKRYKDYISLMVAKKKSKDPYFTFLKRFLKVTSFPALRILNMQDGIKRFSFDGSLHPDLVDNFLDNYRQKNLREYPLNESIREGAMKGVFYRANYVMLKQLLKGNENANLIYVYSTIFNEIDNDLDQLTTINSVFRNNPNFVMYTLNHDKNDIDTASVAIFIARLSPITVRISAE